jgi:iron(III) transport system ATP-binding protein
MRVELKNIVKRFGPLKAVDDVTLSIQEGDFFTLLGPSGCGKTTLLRMIAGFYRPDGGEIRFGDKRVNDVPPHRRETGMVFQNYALFPHLSVFDNIAYGLRARKLPRREIGARIAKIIGSVQLEGMEGRAPSQLSGGQQQRVALARALVISPQILLMDEPLSNLDAKLRVSMREEIRRIQKELGITTIYVTHDQEEAMAVSDRIAILNRGRLEQVGAPGEIYFRPVSRFAAEFMGSSNILEMAVAGYDDAASLITAEAGGQRLQVRGARPAGGRLLLSVRPEWIGLAAEAQAGQANVLSGEVLSSTFLGSMVRYRVAGPGGSPVAIEVHNPDERGVRGNGETLFYRIPPDKPVVLKA